MVQNFSEWLEERLKERGWTAADLTRASQTDENPRGLDSGLISRWRRPAPLGAVPTQAHTLRRLALALGIPEADVWKAAGLPPSDALSSASEYDDADLAGGKFVAALRGVPRKFWVSVVDASVALAKAYGEAAVGGTAAARTQSTEGSVSGKPVPPVRNPAPRPNPSLPSDDEHLAPSLHPGRRVLVGV